LMALATDILPLRGTRREPREALGFIVNGGVRHGDESPGYFRVSRWDKNRAAGRGAFGRIPNWRFQISKKGCLKARIG